MLTPKRHAAITQMREIAAKMRELHAREEALMELFLDARDRPTAQEFAGVIQRVQGEWVALAKVYSEALGQLANENRENF
jgi:hypothetical protein